MSNASARTILVATDADEVLDDIDAALADSTTTLLRVRSGHAVLPAVLEHSPDLVILDLQIGNMGGVAAALELRNEASFGRVTDQSILLLLDRTADVFIAQQSESDGWLVKPLNAIRLRAAADAVLAGGTYEEGPLEEEPTSGPSDEADVEAEVPVA